MFHNTVGGVKTSYVFMLLALVRTAPAIVTTVRRHYTDSDRDR